MLMHSEPVYYVTSGPNHGVLRKRDDVTHRHRKSRDASRRRGKQDRKRKSQRRPPKYVSDAELNFTHGDVAGSRVMYYPMPAAAGTGSSTILEDSFTFVLTAGSAQPVSDSLAIEVIPADYNMAVASPTMTPSATVAPEEVEPAAKSEEGGADLVLIVVIIAVLTLLALVGLIVFWCVRSRRASKKRKLELAAAIDGSGTTAPAASAAVERQSSGGAGSDDGGRGLARPASAAARRGAPPPLPPSLPVIIEPSSTDSGGENSPTTASGTAAAVIPNTPPSDSGASRTGYVRVLPPSPPTSPTRAGLQRNGAPPGTVGDPHHGPRSVWKEQVTFDWEHVDPELLQHCRKTNPVLHKNQYWV